MPLVKPLKPNHDTETKALANFFNETLGFCPNSVLTMQHRPEISRAFINLNKAVMSNKGRVTSALKRMMAWVSSHAVVVAIAKPTPYVLPHAMAQKRKNLTTYGNIKYMRHLLRQSVSH